MFSHVVSAMVDEYGALFQFILQQAMKCSIHSVSRRPSRREATNNSDVPRVSQRRLDQPITTSVPRADIAICMPSLKKSIRTDQYRSLRPSFLSAEQCFRGVACTTETSLRGTGIKRCRVIFVALRSQRAGACVANVVLRAVPEAIVPGTRTTRCAQLTAVIP
ncbi:hypothetical protein BC629DRAFT_457251 [Irpex lacteus]|nr:hypothetical protein BC629DRAFT_457251 [Irpex lacteus]